MSRMGDLAIDMDEQVMRDYHCGPYFNGSDHQCTSKCRRDGCPLCPHGKDERGEHCEVCDGPQEAH
jgi:hypothetical protein